MLHYFEVSITAIFPFSLVNVLDFFTLSFIDQLVDIKINVASYSVGFWVHSLEVSVSLFSFFIS